MLTPQEQQELDYLGSLSPYSTTIDEPTSGLGRVGQHLANLPSKALGSLLTGAVGLAETFTPQEYRSAPITVPQPYHLAPATNFSGKATDFLLGGVAPELASLIVPAMGASKAGRLLGLGERASLAAGDIAAGGISSGIHDDPLAIPEFAAFGMLRPLGAAGRMLGGAGLSVGAQAIRGNNPLTGEGAVRTAADALFSGLDRTHSGSRTLKRPVSEVPVEVRSRDIPVQEAPVMPPQVAGASMPIQEPAPLSSVQPIQNQINISTRPIPVGLSPEGRPPMTRITGKIKPVRPAEKAPIQPDQPIPKSEVETPTESTASILEPPESKPVSAWEEAIRGKMKAKRESGFIDASIFDDVAQYGKRIYQSGMDFATWSGQLIKQFGHAITEFLEESWNRLKKFTESGTKATDADAFTAPRPPPPAPGTPIRNMEDRFYDTDELGMSQAGEIIRKLKETIPELQEGLTRRQGLIANTIRRGSEAMKGVDFEAITPAARDSLDLYARGKMDEATFMALPDVPKEAKTAMQQLKSVQGELQDALKYGESDPRRIALLEQSREAHTARIFRAYSDPKHWKNDPEAFEAVVKEIVQGGIQKDGKIRKGAIQNEEQARGYLRQYIREAREGGDDLFMSGGKTTINQDLYKHRMFDSEADKAKRISDLQAEIGKVEGDISTASARGLTPDDIKALKSDRRNLEIELDTSRETKVLSQAWRTLLGEVKDPFEAKARTIAKIVGSAGNAQFLKFVDDLDIQGVKASMTPEEHAVMLRSDPNGVVKTFVNPESSKGYGVLKGKFLHPEAERAMESISSMNNSLLKGIENSFIGTINSQIKQNLTVRNPGTSARNYLTVPLFLAAARNFNPAHWVEALSELKGKSGPYYQEAVKNGVLGADQVTQEFLQNIVESIFPNRKSLLSPLKKADAFMRRVYQQPDMFVRYVTYRNARKLRNMSESQAIRFTDRYTHNYGASPSGIKTLSNLPFVNPFISYNYQMFKVLKHLAQDVGDSNLSSGERMISGGILTSLLAAPFIVKEAAESILPEDQKEEWERMVRMSPSFAKGQFRVPLKKDAKGSWNYINIDPLLPAGDYAKLVRNLWNRDFKQLISDNPVAGARSTPLMNALAEVISGEELISRKAVPQNAVGLGQALVRNAAPPLAGGYAYQEMKKSFARNDKGERGITDLRTGRSYSPERFVPTLMGVRVGQTNERTLRRSLESQITQQRTEAKRELREILKSNRTQEEKAEARQEYSRTIKRIQEEKRAILTRS